MAFTTILKSATPRLTQLSKAPPDYDHQPLSSLPVVQLSLHKFDTRPIIHHLQKFNPPSPKPNQFSTISPANLSFQKLPFYPQPPVYPSLHCRTKFSSSMRNLSLQSLYLPCIPVSSNMLDLCMVNGLVLKRIGWRIFFTLRRKIMFRLSRIELQMLSKCKELLMWPKPCLKFQR